MMIRKSMHSLQNEIPHAKMAMKDLKSTGKTLLQISAYFGAPHGVEDAGER